jgi:hypothetical protein
LSSGGPWETLIFFVFLFFLFMVEVELGSVARFMLAWRLFPLFLLLELFLPTPVRCGCGVLAAFCEMLCMPLDLLS